MRAEFNIALVTVYCFIACSIVLIGCRENQDLEGNDANILKLEGVWELAPDHEKQIKIVTTGGAETYKLPSLINIQAKQSEYTEGGYEVDAHELTGFASFGVSPEGNGFLGFTTRHKIKIVRSKDAWLMLVYMKIDYVSKSAELELVATYQKQTQDK